MSPASSNIDSLNQKMDQKSIANYVSYDIPPTICYEFESEIDIIPRPTTAPIITPTKSTMELIPPPSYDGSWSKQYYKKGTRATPEQIRYLSLLHCVTEHLSDATMIKSFSTWQGLPNWLNKKILEAFLRSHHCLLYEIFRRRTQHPAG